MKARYKVIISCMVCVMLVLSTTMSVMAGNVKNENQKQYPKEGTSVTLSEKQIILDLQRLDEDMLKELGYNEEQIKKINSFSDEFMLKTLRTYSAAELKKMGYSNMEIYLINDLKQETAMIDDDLYAKLTYNIIGETMYYTNGDTHLRTKANWMWTKQPLYAFTDIIAMTTSNEKFQKISCVPIVNYFASMNTSTAATSETLTAKTAGANTCTYATFPFTKKNSESFVNYVAKTGSMSTYWVAPGKITRVSASAKYGHSKTGPSTPSASLVGRNISNVATGNEAAVDMEI